MYLITKEIYFCYGHRLLHHPGKCRHVHGHSVKAAITLHRATLNEHSMVCDFADIRDCAERYIDEHLDHNLLLHRDDPLIPFLERQGERYLALDEHPTAEVLARMIYEYMKNQNFTVEQVTLWETASAYACYREN